VAILNRKLGNKKGDNVRLEIDLEELYGGEVADRPAARQALGQAIIDAIVDQAESGEDKNGQAFAGKASKYSDVYAESLEFKAFGKSQGDVNMTQTGSMLAALDIREDDASSIEIGWDAGSEDGKKAHGHITGSVGRTRDFFGLPTSELKAIAKRFEDDLKAAPDSEIQTVEDILKIIRAGGIEI
jgi:hypothetical protein